ncbi:MAG: tetratricopeptide repeat protein [Phycisphaerales bacterium]|nr:tetratricopeptide repeat protein [Phycisphaerales bacterium]
MQETDKIERFRNMVLADPQNDLAFFSLGKALLDAGQPREALPALMQAVSLNKGLSPAYALLAKSQIAVGDRDSAIDTLTRGYKVAEERGDMLPRNEMADLLKQLGAVVPAATQETLTPELSAAGNIQCRRCGRIAAKMKERPFSGALGEQIYASVCNACFQLWIRQGTKVINELRLNLTEPAAQDVYDQHMKDFLGLG